MNFSLRQRFLIPMLALIILGMGLSTSITYYKSKDALVHAITSGIQQLVNSTAQQASVFMKDRTLDISSWSQQKVFAVSLKDSFMGKAARKSATHQLQKFSEQYKYYENIFVVNTSGDIVAAADESVIGKDNLNAHEYFSKAMAGDEYVSSVIKSSKTGEPIIIIATPVKDKETVAGVFVGVLDMTSFSKQFVDPIKVGETGYAHIFEANGQIIADPNKDNILNMNMNDFDFGRKMISQGNGFLFYSHDGEEELAAFKTIDGLGWVIAVEMSTDELLAPVRDLSYVNLVVACIVIAFAAVVILLLVNSIVKPVNEIVGGLNDASSQVSDGSIQLSSASQVLAEGASEQAAAIEETSASLEEMSSMTKQNADNAQQANSLMNEANTVVGQANTSMGELIISMAGIAQASEETSKIIKTIDEIAFQTNLLALNAAVEAARAGEAGAGFAVVADEVRNLAMRAAEAAKNTADLIESTVNRVGEGSELVNVTNEAFGQVADSAKQVGVLVEEISTASGEQSQGVDQISKAVNEMDQVVQQNAATAEQSASASQEMSSQSVQMKDLVADLVILVNGRKGAEKHFRSVAKVAGVATVAATSVPFAKTALPSPTVSVQQQARTQKPTVKSASPDDIIPMGDDDDFEDF